MVTDYQKVKEELTTKLNENDTIIKNLRDELEKLTKLHQDLQQQQKEQVNQSIVTKKIVLYFSDSIFQKQLTIKTVSSSHRTATKGSTSKSLF